MCLNFVPFWTGVHEFFAQALYICAACGGRSWCKNSSSFEPFTKPSEGTHREIYKSDSNRVIYDPGLYQSNPQGPWGVSRPARNRAHSGLSRLAGAANHG